MQGLGVPADAYDRVVTSGDVTRDLIAEGPRKIFHIGCERELGLYDGLDVELVEEFEAAGIVCTGLFDDESETPDDYTELLKRLRSRNLPFICANPDIMVERGARLIWCAGALAREYGQLGGRTLIAGKPHRPIYEAALRFAEEIRGAKIDRSRILGIGDGVLTDVKGPPNSVSMCSIFRAASMPPITQPTARLTLPGWRRFSTSTATSRLPRFMPSSESRHCQTSPDRYDQVQLSAPIWNGFSAGAPA